MERLQGGMLLSVEIELKRGGAHQGRIGKLISMGSFDIGQGVRQPGSLRVLEMMQMDGPGFSLCAVPLESSGPRL